MNLTFSQIKRRRQRGFTLTEAMIASATLVVVLGSVIACNLFGISMAAHQHVYLGASQDATKSVSALMNDIRSATYMVVGSYSNNAFVPTPSGAQQSGNALAISTNATQPVGNFPWATSWTLYYLDTTSNYLMRTNFYAGVAPGDIEMISSNPLTNDVTHPIFTEIDHTGTPIIVSQYLAPVSVYLSYTGLDNSQGNENGQGAHFMELQPGNMVDQVLPCSHDYTALFMKVFSAPAHNRARQRGWALLATMGLSAAGLMVMAGVLDWADQNSANTARNNEYFTTCYAAESATQKVLASMSQQFQNFGASSVTSNLSSYGSGIPTTADGAYWGDYQFSGGGVAGQIIVTNTVSSNTVILGAPYTGLALEASTYEIIATARNIKSEFQIPVTVGQKVNFGVIPLFQFAIFYQNLLEFEPNAPMSVTGTVHGNSDIFAAPKDGLWFSNIVSASGQITTGLTSVNDPIDFAGSDITRQDPLNVPVGTNTTGTVSNISDNVYGILQIPTTADETPNSDTGKNLLYNKADLIVLVSNNSITVTSGADINGQSTVLSSNDWGAFMSTNGSFYDSRDGLTVNPVVIDVSNLVAWSGSNTTLRAALANAKGSGLADVQSIYVADMRNTTNAVVTTTYTMATNFTTNSTPMTTAVLPANYVVNGVGVYSYVYPATPTYPFIVNYTTNALTHRLSISSYTYYYINEIISTNSISLTNYAVTAQPGVVLSNGAVLPPEGLSVATPDPAYIVGDWNVKTSFAPGAPSDSGLQDTTYTRPSGIYSDAVTILSSAWNPANSTLALSNRPAVNDTVNAAILTGNVATTVVGGVTNYSGGVENLPRYLENWNNATNTYNGSMVCMFNSHIATQPYKGTGIVFNPPTRNWAFDNNFSDPTKDPPMSPSAISIQRSQWVLLAPNATSF